MSSESNNFQAIKEAATAGALLCNSIMMLIAVAALACLAVF